MCFRDVDRLRTDGRSENGCPTMRNVLILSDCQDIFRNIVRHNPEQKKRLLQATWLIAQGDWQSP